MIDVWLHHILLLDLASSIGAQSSKQVQTESHQILCPGKSPVEKKNGVTKEINEPVQSSKPWKHCN